MKSVLTLIRIKINSITGTSIPPIVNTTIAHGSSVLHEQPSPQRKPGLQLASPPCTNLESERKPNGPLTRKVYAPKKQWGASGGCCPVRCAVISLVGGSLSFCPRGSCFFTGHCAPGIYTESMVEDLPTSWRALPALMSSLMTGAMS